MNDPYMIYDGFEIDLIGYFKIDGKTIEEPVESEDECEYLLHGLMMETLKPDVTWTVFGHLKTGGRHTIIDCHDKKTAQKIRDFLESFIG